MCGRVRLGTDFAQIRIKLQFDETAPLPNMAASWNVCPTDPMLVAINASGKRTPQQMRWGLVPWWAKDIKVGFSSINARAETIDTTRAFRDAWKRGQRCLVVTDGFYEWKKPEKQPYAVGMANDDLMVEQAARDSNGDKAAWRLKPCPSLMFINGAGELDQKHDQDLRDTCVMLLDRAGCDLLTICDITGHSYRSAQTIVKHYRARNADRADAGIDRLELQVRKEGMKG